MKSIEILGEIRENVGKTYSKKLRKNEQVPCVLYGDGSNVHFAVAEKEIGRAIYTPDVYMINLKLDNKNYQALLKDVQYHPVSDKPVHVDLQIISDTKKSTSRLPIIITGSSVGVLEGGRLAQLIRKVKVNGYPKDFPESIEIDITDLKIGQSVKVRDLKSDKIAFIDSPSEVIVAVKTSRNAVVDATAQADDAKKA